MATSKSSKKAPQTRQEILEEAVNNIRTKYGKGSIMCLGDNPLPEVEVLPSGIFPLDVALGVGGYPRGRIVEIFGVEGSGKTTVALQAIAETQRNGGFAAFLDVEHALDMRMAAALGVDVKKLYVSQPDSAEQALTILDSLVRSGAIDLVVLDSVAALTPQAEIDGSNVGESGVGLQARLMSYGLRRLASIISSTKTVVIFINQLRATISTGYGAGPSETTTGGRAMKFYATIRMEIRRGKRIDKGEVAIGHEIFIKIIKNKVAPPYRLAHVSVIYGRGIPTGVSIVDMAIDNDVIQKKGSWLAYKGETLGQGKEAVAKFLAKNPALQAEIKAATLEVVKREAQEMSNSLKEEFGDDAPESELETELETETESKPETKPDDEFAAQLERVGHGQPANEPVVLTGPEAKMDRMLELDSEN